MSLVEVLLHPRLWLAGGIYIFLAVGVTWGTEILRSRLNSPILLWQSEHLAVPLLRVLLLLLFIALGYPVIFGLEQAPSLATLLSSEHASTSSLVNILFLMAVLFPLLPVIGNWQAMILPLQGIIAAAMVFGWLAKEQEIYNISYWPGTTIFLLIVALAYATHYLALALADKSGRRLDAALHIRKSGEFIARSTLLLLQSPAILIYSLALGRQLT